MSWISPSSCFFLLVYVFVTTGSSSGQELEALKVSAVWENDFKPGLSWTPLKNSSCNYTLHVKTPGYEEIESNGTSPWFPINTLEGGFLLWSITAVCGEQKRKPVILNASYTDLVEVESFECYLLSENQAFCEWSPVQHPPDFRFFYALVNTYPLTVLECPSYSYTNGLKTGCRVQGTSNDTLLVLLNGTLNNMLVRNTFTRHLSENVKPAPPTWTVKRNKSGLLITWEVPNINNPDNWSIRIKYKECNVEKEPIKTKKKNYPLILAPRCDYNISVRAESEQGNSSWSHWMYISDAGNGADIWTYLIILIPLVAASMAALTCLFFQRNKGQFCPDIPQPHIPFGHFLDKNECAVPSLYTQEEEEENFKITLVEDPPVNKPDR